mgnify:CR=1 FL=1
MREKKYKFVFIFKRHSKFSEESQLYEQMITKKLNFQFEILIRTGNTKLQGGTHSLPTNKIKVWGVFFEN